VRVAIVFAVLILSGCPDRWDAANPPGVSRARPSGGERATTAERPELLEPLDQTESGELADGDFVLDVDGTLYDVYEFETVAGASIVVTMATTDFDPYLHLIGPGGEQLAHRGVPEGESSPAELVQVAPTTGSYRVFANAVAPGMRGRYELRIVVQPPPRAVD
jgi:hypothetical protein